MHRIGVLGLQGDYDKHRSMLASLGVAAEIVVNQEQIEGIDGLIIPGGESTTMGKLMVSYHLLDSLRRRIEGGMPVFGTCAGMILLAGRIEASDQPRIGLLDVQVNRNAYGRQIASFEADISVSFGASPVRGVFIRAPIVTKVGSDVAVLGEFENRPVLVRQGSMLASSFHPELTEDTRVHEYFLSLLAN